MVFFAISEVTVMLMYLVPFFTLSGTIGPQTLIFWTLTALVYLIIGTAVALVAKRFLEA